MESAFGSPLDIGEVAAIAGDVGGLLKGLAGQENLFVTGCQIPADEVWGATPGVRVDNRLAVREPIGAEIRIGTGSQPGLDITFEVQEPDVRGSQRWLVAVQHHAVSVG